MSEHQYGPAQLIYDAAAEILRLEIGEDGPREIKAYSGGSRGHKLAVTALQARSYLHHQATSLTSHLATTSERRSSQGAYTQRGGTLPPGHYTCLYTPHHPTLKECIKLIGSADTKEIESPFASIPIPVAYRSGFYIHGSGPKGSDGCIVVMTKAELRYICDTILDFPAQALLLVKNVGYQLPAEFFSPGSRSERTA